MSAQNFLVRSLYSMKTIRSPSVFISPHPEVGIECLLKYLSYLTCVSAGVSRYHNG